jgi:ADP-ribose pyrophosphatase YjhB (NUDIX family)
MREFEILVRGCFDPGQVAVRYDEALQMPRTDETTSWIERCWQSKLLQAQDRGVPLYDAPLYRLASAEVQLDGRLHLTLGPTAYKEYVATRDRSFASQHHRQDLSNPLAVCSVLETQDGYLLLDYRQGVDVYENRYHVIGGFFERERDRSPVGTPDPFAAMRREIREETGVHPDEVLRQLCLGLAYDLATPHPELCFLSCLRLSREEVLLRQPETAEAHLRWTTARAESLRSFLFTYHGIISATGESCLLLYGGWRFGEAWYAETLWRLT